MRLCRGQVFEIEGRTFLTIGGGTTEGRTDEQKYWEWWPEQDISDAEEKQLFENLSRYDNRVDYVLTYDIPTSWRKDGSTRTSEVLEELRGSVDYGHWYHYGRGEDRGYPERRSTAVTHAVLPLAR